MAEEPPKSSQPRLRFSLLNLVFLTTIVAMTIALWQLGKQIVPLRQEVQRLRLEAGYLHVEDPTKLHAIGVETAERDYWQWRVYIPEGPSFYLHNQPFDVPKTGTPTQRVPRGGSLIAPGEHFFRYRIKKVEGKKDRLTSLLKGRGDTNYYGNEIEIRERKVDWINTRFSKNRIEASVGCSLRGAAIEPDQPLVLLRLRARKVRVTKHDAKGEPASWSYDAIEEPTDGIMIWIDQFEDNSGLASQTLAETQ